MNILNKKDYMKIKKLVSSQNEISVLSVIHGIMDGEVYVNNVSSPTTALIKTSECNYITGDPNDLEFNSQIGSVLDFWDQLTPDSKDWFKVIPTIHPNSSIKIYTRRHYTLNMEDFNDLAFNIKEGYKLEKVDITVLKQKAYENSEKLLDWIDNWGNHDNFNKYGTGYFIRNDDVIVSWSLSDCSYGNKTAIGVHTDSRYKNNGFALSVVSATIKECFTKGYDSIDWLCVDSNKGSIAIAEKLGFTHQNDYYSFTSYPPIENNKDLTEIEWLEWGKYLDEASKINDQLLLDCLYSYIKANKVEDSIRIMKLMSKKNITLDYLRLNNYINTLQAYGLCSNFTKNEWDHFIKDL